MTLVLLVAAWFLGAKWTVVIGIILLLLYHALMRLPLAAIDTRINCMNNNLCRLMWRNLLSKATGHPTGGWQEEYSQSLVHAAAKVAVRNPP